ncbi:TlpA family protein disulfide reductase [Flavobacterium procerum]|uniref:TlpA family protein disulfide reductase n=1 Tax=Flavobacterium procerum TaxID=1455569 RepID=A0ABV6BNZ7_9FLAO
MRTLVFFLFVLMLNAQSKKDIQIKGKITGKIPEIIEYTLPVNGIDYFGFTDSVQPDALGNFQINLKSDQACFIEILHNYKPFGVLIAEPGMNYTVFINTESKENKFEVQSKNKKGQDLYNQIENRSMIEGGHFELESRKYHNDSIPSEIKQKIEQSRQAELAGFKQLLKDKVISKDFYNLIDQDRNYFYKGVLGSVAFINYLNEPRNKNTLSKKQYSELWAEIFKSNPVTNPKLLSSPWFYFYVQNYLRYNELIVEKISIDALSEIGKQGRVHTHNIENAKKHLSGVQLEYYIAAYLYDAAIQKNYEKELLSLFEQFKKDYPSSPYTTFLESIIVPVVAFHKKKEQPLNEKIKFIENATNLNSIAYLLKSLNGKQFYVDIWATWCSPCKEEFKENAQLYELLKSKNISMVYISIDKESREKQWRDMTHFYNLEGYHIRVNEKLDADLRNLYGNDSIPIPWHFLADENGIITIKKASGPSDIQKLEKQLNDNQ